MMDKNYKEKFTTYYNLWVETHTKKNEAIYILKNEYGFRSCDLSRIFNLSKNRIQQIIQSQKSRRVVG